MTCAISIAIVALNGGCAIVAQAILGASAGAASKLKRLSVEARPS